MASLSISTRDSSIFHIAVSTDSPYSLVLRVSLSLVTKGGKFSFSKSSSEPWLCAGGSSGGMVWETLAACTHRHDHVCRQKWPLLFYTKLIRSSKLLSLPMVSKIHEALISGCAGPVDCAAILARLYIYWAVTAVALWKFGVRVTGRVQMGGPPTHIRHPLMQ